MNEERWTSRTELLLGSDKLKKLKNSHVLIVGLGGVGGYAAEQLCRAGIGSLTLVDGDTVQASNINRQIIATRQSLEENKTDALEARLKAINPDVVLHMINEFVSGERIIELLEIPFDYVVDAIDSLTPKVDLLEAAIQTGQRIVSAMGAGGRMDLSKIQVSDISNSHHCKFAYIVRKYLHRRGIREGIKVVFSTEKVPQSAIVETDGTGNKRSIVGTISYMPAVFGCHCASTVIHGILNNCSEAD